MYQTVLIGDSIEPFFNQPGVLLAGVKDSQRRSTFPTGGVHFPARGVQKIPEGVHFLSQGVHSINIYVLCHTNITQNPFSSSAASLSRYGLCNYKRSRELNRLPASLY